MELFSNITAMQTPGRFKEHDITKQCHLRAFDASTSVIIYVFFFFVHVTMLFRHVVQYQHLAFMIRDYGLKIALLQVIKQ